ncbi:MAG: hypothetical protein PUB22_02715 [Clostridiales bacterium]|nr:hypothetical protein [Clostridiales bacterium]
MIKNYFRCGVLGWCWEIILTGLGRLFTANQTPFMGNTSILMFPIYAFAAFMSPLVSLLRKKSFWFRGTIYSCCIFLVEFISGSWLKKRNICPWDYSEAKWNIRGVIRLDFFPAWFLLGLIFERILEKPKPSSIKKIYPFFSFSQKQ